MASVSVSVVGMTCEHCASAVRQEVGAIPGVVEVDVDLGAGTVTIASDTPVAEADIKAAVEDAGYELAG